MYFLNLSLAQFLAVFGGVAAVSVALYLLDRSRRRQIVSTLRFWVAAEQPSVVARRRHIQQPWSLVLQLASMALILLAVAQLRFGAPGPAGRDHVLILETSAWMGVHTGNRTLMDIARQRAIQYVRALPAGDRVMLVRADALPTPATVFEPDRRKVQAAIAQSAPGSTALNLEQALAFARRVQSQTGRAGPAGEIAFVGTGRTVAPDSGAPSGPGITPPRNFRFIPVPDEIPNAGLRKIGVRRSMEDPDLWQIYASVHNYGPTPRTVAISLDFGPPNQAARIPAGSRQLVLEPDADAEESFELRSRSAGILGVRLSPHDAFPDDDQAVLELPAQPSLSVTVYSERPELLEPLLSANPRVHAIYKRPAQYVPSDPGLVILDHFAPPQRPQSDSLWIDPPVQGSPVPVRSTVEQVSFARWNTAHPAAEGLRTRDFKIEKTSIFETAPDDVRVGEVDAGPVIVARMGKPKIVVFGFHPALSGMRYELAAPLLFANLLRWVDPEIFLRWEVSGASVGAVRLALDRDEPPEQIKVLAENGSALPFTVRDRALHFFSATPGLVRVLASGREYLYSLTLPELGQTKWEPPAEVRRGIPRFLAAPSAAAELWPWLAASGAAGLLAEWLLFGRFRRVKPRRIVLRRTAAGVEVRR